MQNPNQNRTLGVGLLIIAIGLGFLFRQMNVLSPRTENIIFSWQMLLIVIGLYTLFFGGNKTFGFILIIVGGFFILPEVFYLSYDFKRTFWPILLILLGFFILSNSGVFRKKFAYRETGTADINLNYFEEVNIFSGSEKKIGGKNMKGGKITSIFGGTELDLTDTELSSGTNVIEVFNMFGGSSIIVPADWNVMNQVTAILGGFSDKRTDAYTDHSNPEKTLILKGLVVFGGGEIKNK